MRRQIGILAFTAMVFCLGLAVGWKPYREPPLPKAVERPYSPSIVPEATTMLGRVEVVRIRDTAVGATCWAVLIPGGIDVDVSCVADSQLRRPDGGL